MHARNLKPAFSFPAAVPEQQLDAQIYVFPAPAPKKTKYMPVDAALAQQNQTRTTPEAEAMRQAQMQERGGSIFCAAFDPRP
jgi:hypothetical protein